MRKNRHGISSYEISPGLAEAVMNHGFLREQGFTPAGTPEVFLYEMGGMLGGETVRRLRQASTVTPPLVASLVMGLDSGFGKTETFTPSEIRQEVMKRFPKGGSAALQLGWFENTPEDSIRISIENSGTGLSDEEFVEKIEDMTRDLVREFRQKSIWLDYYRGPNRLEAVSFDWKD